jgi:hypothetical protein
MAPDVESAIRPARIAAPVFAAAQAMFLAPLFSIINGYAWPPVWIVVVAPVLTACPVIMIAVMPRLLRRPTGVPERTGVLVQLRAITIVQCTLAGSVGLYGLFLSFIGQTRLPFLVLLPVSIALLLWVIPRERATQAILTRLDPNGLTAATAESVETS